MCAQYFKIFYISLAKYFKMTFIIIRRETPYSGRGKIKIEENFDYSFDWVRNLLGVALSLQNQIQIQIQAELPMNPDIQERHIAQYGNLKYQLSHILTVI